MFLSIVMWTQSIVEESAKCIFLADFFLYIFSQKGGPLCEFLRTVRPLNTANVSAEYVTMSITKWSNEIFQASDDLSSYFVKHDSCSFDRFEYDHSSIFCCLIPSA